jgi:hypothetical protein
MRAPSVQQYDIVSLRRAAVLLITSMPQRSYRRHTSAMLAGEVGSTVHAAAMRCSSRSGRNLMAEQPMDHERILRVSKLVKGLDLEEKLIALSILGNILTIYVQTGRNRSIAVEQQELGGEPGYTVAINGPGLQIIIPRAALDSEPDAPP